MKEIIDLITTNDERKSLNNFLGKLKEKNFDPTISLSELIKSDAPEKFVEVLLSCFSDISFDEAEEILSRLKELEEKIQSIPQATLTITFEPDKSTIDAVRDTLKGDTDKSVVVEFVKSPLLIGGAVIEKDGIIFEHSFRDYFEKRKEAKNGL